jgi:hypothetical protein
MVYVDSSNLFKPSHHFTTRKKNCVSCIRKGVTTEHACYSSRLSRLVRSAPYLVKSSLFRGNVWKKCDHVYLFKRDIKSSQANRSTLPSIFEQKTQTADLINLLLSIDRRGNIHFWCYVPHVTCEQLLPTWPKQIRNNATYHGSVQQDYQFMAVWSLSSTQTRSAKGTECTVRASIPGSGKEFRQALWPTLRPIQLITANHSKKLKQPGLDTDNSNQSSAEVKNKWSYTATPF